jgi:RNA 2',3'-cyclic 3'-phosphodiesterase
MTSRDPASEALEPRLRLFVALELPDAWLKALSATQDELRRRVEGGPCPRLRWVRPEGIHLTLKFLGSVEADRREVIEGALAAIEPGLFRFSLSLGAPGSFGDRRGPRVIWAGLEGDLDRLGALASAVEGALSPLGFPTEARAFNPHLTLARVPDDFPASARRELSSQVERLSAPRVAAMSVQGLSLMRSHLGRGGARYERLAYFS